MTPEHLHGILIFKHMEIDIFMLGVCMFDIVRSVFPFSWYLLIESSEQPGGPVNLGASEWSSGFLAKDWPKSGFRSFGWILTVTQIIYFGTCLVKASILGQHCKSFGASLTVWKTRISTYVYTV